MRLREGQRVSTDLGPGKIVSFRKPQDLVPPHGKPTRGLAYAVVELERGGRRLYPAGELRPAE